MTQPDIRRFSDSSASSSSSASPPHRTPWKQKILRKSSEELSKSSDNVVSLPTTPESIMHLAALNQARKTLLLLSKNNKVKVK
jgi:hypothetical protein